MAHDAGSANVRFGRAVTRGAYQIVSMNNGGPTVVHSGQGPWGFPPGGSGNGSGRPPPGGGGPWGGGGGPGGPRPGGPGGGRPGGPGPIPDIDVLIASLQAAIRRFLGGGGGPRMRFTGGRPLLLLLLAVIVLWLGSSFYRVEPDQLGVVMRFGAYSYRTEPGLHWHLPWPIEHVLTPAVTRINRTEIGYRSGGPQTEVTGGESGGRDVPSESLMLTGDENIIDINLTVFWKINNAQDYLFNVRDPDNLVKAVAESSIREVIGRTPIQPALNTGRPQIESDVHTQTQQILDRYGAGIEITQVTLQGVNPPARWSRASSTCSAPTPTPSACATRPRPTPTTSSRAPAATPPASCSRARARSRLPWHSPPARRSSLTPC